MVFPSFLVIFCLPVWVVLFPQAPPFYRQGVARRALGRVRASALQAESKAVQKHNALLL